MKKAFGMLELLIVAVIVIVLYFTCFHSNYGRSNPFDDNARINSQKEIVDKKVKEVENKKLYVKINILLSICPFKNMSLT